MNRAEILDYVECWSNGEWFEPPVSFAGLAKSFRASTHHSSALFFKANVLASTFRPHRWLSRHAFERWALDFLTFGNGYLERRRNMVGGTLRLEPALAKYVRRKADFSGFVYVNGWQERHEFEPDSVFQLVRPDINQEVYGLPEYLSSLHSAWLNESSTLFRRKYYENGSHAGFILYMTDAAQKQDDVDNMRDALKNAKGPGNFRNVFMYAPGGKKDGIQLIPVSEVAAKDEFFNIKNVTRDDLLAARPHRWLSRHAFERWALDFLTFGNGYLERRRNMVGGTLRLEPALAKYVRRKADFSGFVYVNGWQERHEFEPDSVFQLVRPDINQEVYGLPEYLSSLHSAWLNESSTLFRRKYYENGSHAGFILYMTDAAQKQDDVDNMRDALKNAKGPGNFRNVFMYAPGGKKDGIQLIPVSEVAAKDEFFNIKNVTRDDLLAAHRVPPQLLGIVPSNSGGFGTPDTAARVFGRNEIRPLQARFAELNDWLGDEVVRFDDYEIPPAPVAA
ncbi:portal protein [Burkholderia pseudomallei]|nr:portal protein [Burkholderia pseudomallei]